MSLKFGILAGSALVGSLFYGQAQAIPYADASNVITGISITGGLGSILPLVTGTAAHGTTTAQFGALIGGHLASGVVNGTTDVLQATAGPGPFPGENVFTPRAGLLMNMIGSRGDALITAGVAGTVSASNVAESRGIAIGGAQGKDDASINFNATLTDPGVLNFSFNLAAYLEASTASLIGESANATIKNDILVTNSAGARVFEFTPNGAGAGTTFGGIVLSDPFNANGQVNSTSGIPVDPIFTNTGFFSAMSNLLGAGTYNIAVVSSSLTSIQPGVPVPEPSALGILGLGLLGVGLIRTRFRSA